MARTPRKKRSKKRLGGTKTVTLRSLIIVACLAVALVALAQVPDFLAARAKTVADRGAADQCQVQTRLLRDVEAGNEALRGRFSEHSQDRNAFSSSLAQHARFLRETADKAAGTASGPGGTGVMQRLASQVSALASACEGLALVLNKGSPESVGEWQERLRTAEGPLRVSVELISSQCPNQGLVWQPFAEELTRAIPAPASIAAAPADEDSKLANLIGSQYALELERAATTRDKAEAQLEYNGVYRAEKLTSLKWVHDGEQALQGFKAASAALEKQLTGRDQFLRRALSAKKLTDERAAVVLAHVRPEPASQVAAALRQCGLDQKRADLLLQRLAILRKNMGKWKAQGAQPIFENERASEAYVELGRELSQLDQRAAGR